MSGTKGRYVYEETWERMRWFIKVKGIGLKALKLFLGGNSMYKKSKKAISKVLVFLILVTAMFGNIGNANVLAGDTTSNRKIDVWDFGGVQVSGTSYNNNIAIGTLDGLTAYLSSGTFTKSVPFGDLTVVNPGGYNRLYYYAAETGTTKGTLSYGNPTSKTFTLADNTTYTSRGSIYHSGDGNDSTKYIEIKNIIAGDRISVYGFVTNGSGPATLNFALTGSGTTGKPLTQIYDDQVNSNGQQFDFFAPCSGTLKIYFSNGQNSCKPNIARVVRTPGVKVSGILNLNGYALSGYSLVFQNQSTADKEIYAATLNADGTYDVSLPAGSLPDGYKYTAVLQGVSSDYSISDETKLLTITTSDFAAGINNRTLNIEKKPMATISGNISGFSSSYDLNNFKITFTPPAGSLAPLVEATIDKVAKTYTADVRIGQAYTTALLGVDDYEITAGNSVNISTSTTQDITVDTKPLYAVSGTFVGLPSTAAIHSIAFKHIKKTVASDEFDGYVYSGTVTGGGYTASLRDGAYTVAAVCSDNIYTTIGHVVVSGSNTTKDIKFTSSAVLPDLAWVSDLYVGDNSRANNYGTVKEALAAAARMKPTSEDRRITVHIAPGTYREQLKIATPYISLVNSDPGREVKITWYYGVGYDYYSAGSDGFYNEDRAFDKYAKGFPGNAKWGATVFLTSTAMAFKAENIVFENSFNKYMTSEELADGVQVTAISTPSNLTARTAGLDVTSRPATERAAAMGIEADNVEFYKCSFLSSQDTLYTGTSSINQYYKDCFIEGNTDYIFGDGNAVFDHCTLNFCGYSDQASGGYITAAKDGAPYGYLFRDCTVTANSNNKQAAGYFGRPWGQGAKVKFTDTKLQDSSLISPQGWTDMSGSTAEKANFKEYNTTYNGVPVDTSARRGGVLSGDAAVTNATNYFGSDWTPKYYTPGSVTAPVLQVSSTSQTQVELTWLSSTSTRGSVIYAVYKDGQKLVTTTEAAYTVGNLSPSTAYTFKVMAMNTAGDTAVSSDVQATTKNTANPSVPGAPSISATAGDGTATITWSAVPGATSYTVKGRTVSSSVYSMVYSINNATVTSYTYSGLTNGTTYYFVVTASNGYGESAPSAAVSVTPAKTKITPGDFVGYDIGSPTIKSTSSFDDDTNLFTLTAAGTGITKNATGGDQFHLMAVKLKGDYTISAKVNVPNWTSAFRGLMGVTIRESLNHDSYHYSQMEQYASTAVGGRKIYRYNAANGSNGSNNNMPLEGTAYIRLTKIGDKITSIFSSSPIPENPVASSTLVISTATATNLGLDADGNPKELYAGLALTSTNAASAVTVTFEDVEIVMADGTVVFDANEGKPVAPKNVTVKPYDASATITWDALSTATSYTVKQSTGAAGPFTAVQTVTGSVYQTQINGLENDKTYYYVVTASNSSGESVPSKVVSVTPSASVLIPPVITMASDEPTSEVFSALLPLSGSVDKASTLTIKNNGSLIKLDGVNTSLSLSKNGTFRIILVLVQGANSIEIKAVDAYGNETVKNYKVTYTYKAAKLNYYDTNGSVITGLTPGKDIVVKADVENYIAATKDTVLVVGLYDAGNNLVKFIYTAEAIPDGESEVFYAKLKLPEDVSGYTVKAYVWDSFAGAHPISDAVVLK